jgi:polar amino acid transport system substrate-binding protein
MSLPSALACCAWFAFAAAPLVAQDRPQLPQRYREAGVLRWASDAEGGAPFVYIDVKDPTGREIGFEVDIAAEIGRVLGVRMVRVQAGFANLVQELDRGDCDFAMNGLEPLPERRQQVLFTRPYYIFQQQLTVAKTTTGITTMKDLVGKRVGVLGQSQSHKIVVESGAEAVIYENNLTAYQDVENGRTVASLADLPIARALVPQLSGLRDVGEPFDQGYYCIAVRRGEPELRQALDATVAVLWRDGVLERVYRKWDLWVPAEARLGDAELAREFQNDGSVGAVGDMAWGVVFGRLLKGAWLTFRMSVAAFAIAVLLGLAIALARLHGPAPVRWLALAYVELLRGTPILVQMLLLYYGLGQVAGLNWDAWVVGIIGLALNYAAYEAEVYRGALSAIPRGQREAALALGLSGSQTLRYVVIPQALRLSLAPSTNDFIALFKDSSIVMVITVVELTKEYQLLASATTRYILLGIVTSALYLAMSLPLAYLARRFERHLDKDRT